VNVSALKNYEYNNTVLKEMINKPTAHFLEKGKQNNLR
jgi:hypothetical protein